MKYVLPIAGRESEGGELGGIVVGDDFEIDPSTGVLNIKDMDAMQSRVEQLAADVVQAKADLAQAVSDKGVPTQADASWAEIEEGIRGIQTGRGMYAECEQDAIGTYSISLQCSVTVE